MNKCHRIISFSRRKSHQCEFIEQCFLDLSGKSVLSHAQSFEKGSKKKIEVGIYDFSKAILQIINMNWQ